MPSLDHLLLLLTILKFLFSPYQITLHQKNLIQPDRESDAPHRGNPPTGKAKFSRDSEKSIQRTPLPLLNAKNESIKKRNPPPPKKKKQINPHTTQTQSPLPPFLCFTPTSTLLDDFKPTNKTAPNQILSVPSPPQEEEDDDEEGERECGGGVGVDRDAADGEAHATQKREPTRTTQARLYQTTTPPPPPPNSPARTPPPWHPSSS